MFTEPPASLKKIPNNPGSGTLQLALGNGEGESGYRAGDDDILDVHRRGTGRVGDHRPGVGVVRRWIGRGGFSALIVSPAPSSVNPSGMVSVSVVVQLSLRVIVIVVGSVVVSHTVVDRYIGSRR